MAEDARRAFLTELIDDAGLFPPASLSMEDAAAGHEASRTGPHAWMLARFICVASRLPELLKVLPDAAPPWRVSVILDATGPEPWLERMTADVAAAGEFAEEAGPRAAVELVETVLPADVDTSELRRFVERVEEARLPRPVMPFFEIPPATLPDALTTVAEVRRETAPGGACLPAGAKLRCGGARAELFPAPDAVAATIDACRRLDVPLKATAGLHHPFRHRDEPTGFVQHGFVNLVGASVLSHARELPVDRLVDIVEEQDPSAFSLTPERFAWRDLEAPAADIAAARAASLVGYGSCSFDEPVEDLLALGVLPA
jgi:hypothetical protein